MRPSYTVDFVWSKGAVGNVSDVSLQIISVILVASETYVKRVDVLWLSNWILAR